MSKLSDTQAMLLSAAAARPDLNLLPIPDTIRLKGAALNRTLKSLRNRGFVTESDVAGGAGQSNGTGKQLLVTSKGLAAIGVDMPEADPDEPENMPDSERRTISAGIPDRPGGKLGVLLDAVAKPSGATLDELTTDLCWLPHTTRAAITRLRRRGFDVRLVTSDGRKMYQLKPAA